MKKILKLIEEIKVIMKNKKKIIDKLYERSRKNVIIESIMILEEVENENEVFEDDNDNENKLEL